MGHAIISVMRHATIILAISLLVLAGCGGPKSMEDVDLEKAYACDSDSDCDHVAGCHEDGGSACVNKRYAKVMGSPKDNCDPNEAWPCTFCVCEDGKCANEVDMKSFGC